MSVPFRTGARPLPFGPPPAGLKNKAALQGLRCAIENSAEEVNSVQCVRCRVMGRGGAHVENHMLLIVGAVIVLIAVVIIPRMRVPGGVNASALGWMSERWLAEYRASH